MDDQFYQSPESYPSPRKSGALLGARYRA